MNNIFLSLSVMHLNKLKKIASGCNSDVYIFGQGDNQVALKVVPSCYRKEQRHMKNQFQMLSSLQHKHIIKPLKYQQNVAFQRNQNKHQLRQTNNILVLEHASQGSLIQFIQKQKMPIYELRLIFMQVAKAVKYLHERDVVHRDLKLENILVFQEKHSVSAKLCDFGFATLCVQNNEKLFFNHYIGTKKGYMAPQIASCHDNKDLTYDPVKCDIFALGVCLFALIFKRLPFEYATAENRLYKLLIEKKGKEFWSVHFQQKVLFHDQEQINEEFRQLFQRMVSYEPSQRPTIEQVYRNEWLNTCFNEVS